MKKLTIILLLLSAVLTTSCSIYNDFGFKYEQLSSIKQGMNFEEVCHILGKPAFRDLNKDGEMWTFRSYGLSGWSVVKVWFKEGKLTQMESYLENTCPTTHPAGNDFQKQQGKTANKKIESSIYVSPEGKHYVKMGSVVVTPEGKHIIVP